MTKSINPQHLPGTVPGGVHCPPDCSCRGTMGRTRMEQARDAMPQDAYDVLVAQALAMVAAS